MVVVLTYVVFFPQNVKDLCGGHILEDSDFQTLPYRAGVGHQTPRKSELRYCALIGCYLKIYFCIENSLIFGLHAASKEIIWNCYNKV